MAFASPPRPEVRHDLDAASGPGWVGCSLERATPPRLDVRHDLDAASGATASFRFDRLARPGPMPHGLQLAEGPSGPRWVGCSLERATSPRPEVRHDLDAASGKTALLGPAYRHGPGPRSGTTWCSFGCGRLALPGPVPSWMQLAGGLPDPRWVGCSLESATARGQARPGCSFGVRPPCYARSSSGEPPSGGPAVCRFGLI